MKTDNELIAQFMGMRYRRSAGPLTGEFYDEVKQTLNANWQSTHWHKSWDWLMPVVEKIRELSVAVEISFSLGVICKICYKNGKNFEWLSIEDNGSINAVYKAVVEFIKWYNENKS